MEFNEIYLQYGVYRNSILVKVTKGYFASDAWMISDEAYADIIGTSFGIIAGDDAKQYNVSKFNIRRLKSIEEFNSLLEKCHPVFKYYVEKSSDSVEIVNEISFNYKCSLAEKYNPDKVILSLAGCHIFTPTENGWSHTLAVFQESNVKELHNTTPIVEELESVKSIEEVFDLVYRISGHKTKEECLAEKSSREDNRITAWEFYC